MCFSATASFVAGASLSAIGVANIASAERRSELPLPRFRDSESALSMLKLTPQRGEDHMQQSSKSEYVPALSFNWLTPYYDAVVGTTTRERAVKQALIQQACIKAGQQVLDLACGTGTLAIWIKQSEPLAIVTGVDGDPAILSIAARKARRANVSVQFDHALSHNLPYPAAHFDRVVSSLFFHHLTWQNKERTAEELFRVLKPGAELHVADWGYPANALMRGLFVSIQLLDGFRNTQDNVSGKLMELFEQAGFAEVAQRQTFSTIYGTMALYSAVKKYQVRRRPLNLGSDCRTL